MKPNEAKKMSFFRDMAKNGWFSRGCRHAALE
jgi:hypothetical protein